MEKWNDNIIRAHIEEIITESYLLCISEKEMRKYLKFFLDSCETVLSDRIDEQRNLKLTEIRAAILKAYLLLSTDSLSVANPAKNAHRNIPDSRSSREQYAKRVVGARSLIIRLLVEYDPEIAGAALKGAERRGRTDRGRTPVRETIRTVLHHTVYVAMLAATVFMMRLILFP